jgi:hypothetical protein
MGISAGGCFVFNYGGVTNFTLFCFYPYGTPFVSTRMKFSLGVSKSLHTPIRFLPFLPSFGILKKSLHVVNFAPTKHKFPMFEFLG